MAVTVEKLGFVYLASPGTGSTTLEGVLTALPSGRLFPGRDIIGTDGYQMLDAKHCTFGQLQTCFPDQFGWVTLVVTSIRNPYDFWYAEWHRNRTVWINELKDPNSWVFRQKARLADVIDSVRLDFSDWVVNRLQRAYSGPPGHLHAAYLNEAGFVIRMEHMQQDVETLLRQTGYAGEIGAISARNRNPGKDSDYWRHYDRRARDCVERCFGPTLEAFGYRF